jgi:hypothetical protein
MIRRRVKLAAGKSRALLSVGCLDPHGVARTEARTSYQGPSTCCTSCICQLLIWTILLTGPGIRLGTFMRLREAIAVKSPGSRKRGRSSITRGGGGGCGSGWGWTAHWHTSRAILIHSRHTDAHQNQIKLTFDDFDISPIFV